MLERKDNQPRLKPEDPHAMPPNPEKSFLLEENLEMIIGRLVWTVSRNEFWRPDVREQFEYFKKMRTESGQKNNDMTFLFYG